MPLLILVLSAFKSDDKAKKKFSMTNRAVLDGPDRDKAWFNPITQQWQTTDKPEILANKKK